MPRHTTWLLILLALAMAGNSSRFASAGGTGANPTGVAPVVAYTVPSQAFGGGGYSSCQTGRSSWSGYGLSAPAYNWGNFGAHYWPTCHKHRGYYGDFIQWRSRCGY